jgi:hypothetical protein
MKKLAWTLCFPLLFAGCNFGERVPIEMVTTSQNQPLQKEKALDSTIRFDIGSLEITGERASGSLYSYDMEYDKASFAPNVRYNTVLDGTEGRFFISLESSHKAGIHAQRLNNRLRLALSNGIPLKLQVVAGVGDTRLSLSGLKISSLDFESGVGEAKMSAYEPNSIPCDRISLKNGVGRLEATGLGNLNFKELEFDGGVGGATLDLTGEWKQNADIRIQVGMGGVNVRIPRDIGVKVESAQNFLSGLHLEGFNKQDSFYYSENYGKAATRVSIHVTTGIGGLRITWI